VQLKRDKVDDATRRARAMRGGSQRCEAPNSIARWNDFNGAQFFRYHANASNDLSAPTGLRTREPSR
jgi:hypothetical protein